MFFPVAVAEVVPSPESPFRPDPSQRCRLHIALQRGRDYREWCITRGADTPWEARRVLYGRAYTIPCQDDDMAVGVRRGFIRQVRRHCRLGWRPTTARHADWSPRWVHAVARVLFGAGGESL